MILARLYQHLYSRALATGRAQAQNLTGGARVAVEVRGEWIAVTFSRRDKPLGTAELITFHNHCNVPPGAQRMPVLGQRTRTMDDVTWHSVSYQWRAAAADVIAAEEVPQHV